MKHSVKLTERRYLGILFPFLLLVVLVAAFAAVTRGRFITVDNLTLMVNQCLILGTISTGAVFIFGTGNVNLAMGGMAAMSAVVGGYVYLWTESIVATLIGCIVGGIVFSYVSVLLSDLTRMNLLTITTVLMMLYPAMQSWILGANSISFPYVICSKLQKAQVPLIAFVVFLLLCIVVFYFTPVGRSLRFIGDNERCAQLTGLDIKRVYQIAFLMGGLACGLGAFSTIVRTGVVSVTTLSTGNMNVVLSIVIGGTPVSGGYKAQVYAGVLGAAVLTVLDGGLLMCGVDSGVLQAVKGILFMAFVVLTWTRPQGLAVKEA